MCRRKITTCSGHRLMQQGRHPVFFSRPVRFMLAARSWQPQTARLAASAMTSSPGPEYCLRRGDGQQTERHGRRSTFSSLASNANRRTPAHSCFLGQFHSCMRGVIRSQPIVDSRAGGQTSHQASSSSAGRVRRLVRLLTTGSRVPYPGFLSPCLALTIASSIVGPASWRQPIQNPWHWAECE